MIQSKTSKEIKEYILNLEQEYPVNQWNINGVDVWPYIRIKLFIFLSNRGGNKPKLNNTNSGKGKKPSAIVNLIKIPGSLINALASLTKFNLKLRPKKIIFFGSHFHRTYQDGIYFNRFFDPMIDEYQLQDEVYSIEFEKVYNNNYNQKAILNLHKYLDQYKYLKKFRHLLESPDEGGNNLIDYETFLDEISSEFPEAGKLNISIEGVQRWAKKINGTKGFFINFYKKTKPEKVIFLSYYGYDDLAAAILAAHQLGIKTIDFQHGPQTNVHMAYNSWTKHPDRPYNIMPLEYWTWDKTSKTNIEEWAQKTDMIRTKNVGHPYLSYFKKKILLQDVGEKIFFSLQTLSLEEMFPANFLDIVKESKLVWIFRMHPRSNFTTNDLISFLIKNEIPERIYEIEDALQVPLPESLACAKLHITNFSGCVIEASMLNIPSLLIHESGKEMFRAYIDDKTVFYLNPDEPGFKKGFRNILEKKLPKKNIVDEFREIPNPLLI